jgi:hypothetical protein
MADRDLNCPTQNRQDGSFASLPGEGRSVINFFWNTFPGRGEENKVSCYVE